MTTAITKTEFNERLKSAREEAGLSLMDVAFEIRQRLPKPMWISLPTLHRIETTKDEGSVDPFLICVLAGIYNVKVSDLSEQVASYLDSLRTILISVSRCRANSARQQPIPGATG